MGDCNTLKTFPNPHHCDPHLDQTKFNDLLPLTIDGVLVTPFLFHQELWYTTVEVILVETVEFLQGAIKGYCWQISKKIISFGLSLTKRVLGYKQVVLAS